VKQRSLSRFKEDSMAVQALAGSFPTLSSGGFPKSPVSTRAFELDGQKAGNARHQTAVLMQSLQADGFRLQMQSSDGDTVSVSLDQLQLQKTMMITRGDNLTEEDWNRLVADAKDQFASLRESLLRAFLKSMGQDIPQKTDVTDQAGDDTQIAEVPEYWNAENTSQRIVDFALSFAGGYSGTNDEFVKTIKAAIDEGFKQAGDMLGNLPTPVQNLVNATHDLVMKKIDQWLSDKTAATLDANA
jgi:hypothetical protein